MDGRVVVQVTAVGQLEGPDAFGASVRLRQGQNPDQDSDQNQGD